MQPGDISSGQHIGVEFLEALADTLEDYGLERNQVRLLPPALLNFMYYQSHELEELEQQLLTCQEAAISQAKTLKRVRSQRNALRAQIEHIRAGLEEVTADAFGSDQLPVLKV